MKKSKRAMPYWICIAIGALIFAGVASMRSIWTLSEMCIRDSVTGGATHSDGRKQGGSRVSRPFRSI